MVPLTVTTARGSVSMISIMHVDYHNRLMITVAGVSMGEQLDLELQAEEGARGLPRVRVVPAKHPALTDMQAGEFRRPHCV